MCTIDGAYNAQLSIASIPSFEKLTCTAHTLSLSVKGIFEYKHSNQGIERLLLYLIIRLKC